MLSVVFIENYSYTKLIEELTDYTRQLELIGGYNYQGETAKILLGEDFDKLTDTFSVGLHMHLKLTK